MCSARDPVFRRQLAPPTPHISRCLGTTSGECAPGRGGPVLFLGRCRTGESGVANNKGKLNVGTGISGGTINSPRIGQILYSEFSPRGPYGVRSLHFGIFRISGVCYVSTSPPFTPADLHNDATESSRIPGSSLSSPRDIERERQHRAMRERAAGVGAVALFAFLGVLLDACDGLAVGTDHACVLLDDSSVRCVRARP